MNEVYLSPEAENDLEKIKTYITEELENPAAALATVSRITNSLRILQAHASAGAPLSSVTDVESDYRFLVSGNYLTFYRVVAQDVYIDRILYGRRNYLAVLFGDALDSESSS